MSKRKRRVRNEKPRRNSVNRCRIMRPPSSDCLPGVGIFLMRAPCNSCSEASGGSRMSRASAGHSFSAIHPSPEAFTHRSFYTQTLLHTEAFTHRGFYTQTLLHTDAFTHKHFHTHRGLHTQTLLLHTDAFTHRRFYTQTSSFELGGGVAPGLL